jgi:hypothetical protein
MMTKDIRYVAKLPHVREVSIVGTADLAFWADRLRAEHLAPLAWEGRAQILLIAADSRYLGLPFQELSVSVVLGAGAFLVQAFNSRPFFAFCERTLFGTPYASGDLRVAASLPASVQLTRKRSLLFRAEMGAGATPSLPGISPYQDGWEGPLFLPARHPGRSQSRLFFAQIRGAAQAVSFQLGRDVLEIRPSNELPVLQELIDSAFQATHWLVREDAMHAKSKTYLASRMETSARP